MSKRYMKHIGITWRAAELLDAYRETQGGISYTKAVGRLLGVELPSTLDWRQRMREAAARREKESGSGQ